MAHGTSQSLEREAIMAERTRVTDELRLWSDVFHSAAFGIVIVDPASNAIRFANEAYATTHGMSVSEFQGMSIFGMYPPAERERVTEFYATSDRDGQVDYVIDRQRKDGSIFPAYVHNTSVRGQDGKVRYRIGTVQDITAERLHETARKDAEEHLRLTSLYTRNLIEASLDPLVTISADGKVTDVNKAAEYITGLPRNRLIGSDFADYFTEPEKARTGYRLAFAEGSVKDYPLAIQHVSGKITDVLYNASTFQDEQGNVVGVFAAARDITVQRQLQSELDQSRRLESIGQLTAGIAHDFNNILQGIMANLELVDDDIDVPPATREYVSSAVRLAEQAGELTSSLLSFSRKQLLSPNEVNVGDFLSRFQRLLSRTLNPQIRIDIVTEPGLAPIWVDARHLQSALLNLAINARDAMPSGGNLSIEAFGCAVAASKSARFGTHVEGQLSKHDGRSDHYLTIRVSDTGTGIAPENLSRICEPFFSTKGVNGNGLGLSMVHGFAEQSGGDLSITSELGKGTCVEVRLPLSHTHGDAMPASLLQSSR